MDCSPEAQHYLIYCYEWSFVHYYNCNNWSFLITIFAYEMSSIYWVSPGCCFSHSVCFVTYLRNFYERGMQTFRCYVFIVLQQRRFPRKLLISHFFCVFTLYTPKNSVIYPFIPLLGILLLVDLDIPHSRTDLKFILVKQNIARKWMKHPKPIYKHSFYCPGSSFRLADGWVCMSKVYVLWCQNI